MPTYHVNAGTGVDTRDFAKFARVLRRYAPELAVELKDRLRLAGLEVADAARANASFSSQIPPTVKVRVSAATTKIVAGSVIGGLEELGNKGGGGGGDTFKHPVFGNTSVWVDQPRHPFLRPAMKDHADSARAAVLEGLDEVVGKVVAMSAL